MSRKYQPGQLAKYLAEPTRWHPATRMPSFELSAAEQQALTDYLLDARGRVGEESRGGAGKLEEFRGGDAARGRQAFATLGCARCHAVERPEREGELVGRSAVVAIKDSNRGCLADEPQRVRFAVSEEERAALRQFVSQKNQVVPPVGDAAEHFVARLRCTACHQRDHRSADLRVIIAEESERGLVPEALPNLTFAGDRLRASWLEQQFLGTAHKEPLGRARPWLKARMPAFPAYASVLAAGMASQHGRLPEGNTAEATRSLDKELAEVGRRLTFAQSGLDCRQCHAVGQEQPTGDAGTRIAPGINFSLVNRRLNDDFFSRFVTNPPRYDVTTKMPRLVPDGRTSKVTDVFDGDAQRQFSAIWEYLRGL